MVKLAHGLKVHKICCGSTYNRREPTPFDNDRVLLQHQEKEGDSK
jgi:hypothetical protein